MSPIRTTLAALVLTGFGTAQIGWTRVSTTASPVALAYHRMVYDSARKRSVLFGGSTSGNPNSFVDDTWEYDGRNWLRMRPSASPVARWAHGMAYDSTRARTVLFGGRTAAATGTDDTWEYDGGAWTRITPAASPPARRVPEMVYDSARQRVVLFGGAPSSNVGYLADTWEYDGRTWTRITTRATPPGRINHGLAYDASRRRTVLFGGFNGRFLTDTWEYDGQDWSLVSPSRTAPSGDGNLLYDSHRQRVLKIDDSTGVWEWDGRNWESIAGGSAPMRFGQGLAFDADRRRVVMFGGWWANTGYGDTWEFTADSLTASPASLPIATGGTQTLTLTAGSTHGGQPYVVFGSMSGPTPGIVLDGFRLPLNPDAYSTLVLGLLNTAPFMGFQGTLTAAGTATARLNIPANLPIAAGFRVHHAFVVLASSGAVRGASLPVSLDMR